MTPAACLANSHACVNAAEELLMLEYSQRLQTGQRNVLATAGQPDTATTMAGDIWQLGNHRLMCGDSSKPEDLDRLLDGSLIRQSSGRLELATLDRRRDLVIVRMGVGHRVCLVVMHKDNRAVIRNH